MPKFPVPPPRFNLWHPEIDVVDEFNHCKWKQNFDIEWLRKRGSFLLMIFRMNLETLYPTIALLRNIYLNLLWYNQLISAIPNLWKVKLLNSKKNKQQVCLPIMKSCKWGFKMNKTMFDLGGGNLMCQLCGNII